MLIILNHLVFYFIFSLLFFILCMLFHTPAALLMLWPFRVIMVSFRGYIVHGKQPSNYNITILFQCWWIKITQCPAPIVQCIAENYWEIQQKQQTKWYQFSHWHLIGHCWSFQIQPWKQLVRTPSRMSGSLEFSVIKKCVKMPNVTSDETGQWYTLWAE